MMSSGNRDYDTKVILMSPSLLGLYELFGAGGADQFQPLTFCRPQECLDMLIDEDDIEDIFHGSGGPDNADRIQRQWGELELRLSFFTDSLTWN